MKKCESETTPKQLLQYVAAEKSPHTFYLFEFEQNVRSYINYNIQNIQQETKRREIFSLIIFKKIDMKKIVKQVLGIDVAQKELVVCFGIMYDTWIPELVAYKVFVNNEKGFDELFKWVTKLADSNVAVRYVMEATGVYHEKFAYYLCDKNLEVSIVLPNKISNYSRSLETKTVTDKTSSEAITLFGLERVLDRWFPAKGIYKQLQQLTR